MRPAAALFLLFLFHLFHDGLHVIQCRLGSFKQRYARFQRFQWPKVRVILFGRRRRRFG